MTNRKLIIDKLILKKACAAIINDFYDPFASFYMLPMVEVADKATAPLFLVDGSIRWANHMVSVSYNDTRQMKPKVYALDLLEDFELHLHLVQQKASSSISWRRVQEQFRAPVRAPLSMADFESYPLATIPVAWKTLEQMHYENETIEIELSKKK